uniref:Uncharacterized protein n=1 Tax=Acrobeloides nanus TaxID=290746 RepID=A0A914BYX0_9BILA
MLMQYIPVPMAIIIASQFMWQASHGASVFTYIFINKTMRREAILLLKELVGASAYRIGLENPRSVHIIPSWLGRSGGTAATIGT